MHRLKIDSARRPAVLSGCAGCGRVVFSEIASSSHANERRRGSGSRRAPGEPLQPVPRTLRCAVCADERSYNTACGRRRIQGRRICALRYRTHGQEACQDGARSWKKALNIAA